MSQIHHCRICDEDAFCEHDETTCLVNLRAEVARLKRADKSGTNDAVRYLQERDAIDAKLFAAHQEIARLTKQLATLRDALPGLCERFWHHGYQAGYDDATPHHREGKLMSECSAHAELAALLGKNKENL